MRVCRPAAERALCSAVFYASRRMFCRNPRLRALLAGSPFGRQHMGCFVRLPVVNSVALLEEAPW